MNRLIDSTIKSLIALGISVGFAFFSKIALAAPSLNESMVLCKNNKTVRTLRVEVEDQRCRAIYTKSGVDTTIGSGQFTNSCHEFVENVRKNLESANWNCRDVKEARISTVLTGAE